MSILKKLESFQRLDGYLGAGVFSYDGRMLAGVTEVSGVSFEIAGKLFHDAFLIVNNNSREAGFGRIDMLQMDAEIGTVLAKSCVDVDNPFHILLVMNRDANIARAKLELNKVTESLKEEFDDDLENWAMPKPRGAGTL